MKNMENCLFTTQIRKHLKGLNISALAKTLDIPSTLLHDWFQGRRIPSVKNISHIKKIAYYLELSLDELLVGPAVTEELSKNKVLTNLTFDDSGKSYEIKIIRKNPDNNK